MSIESRSKYDLLTTRICILITLVSALMLGRDVGGTLEARLKIGSVSLVLEQLVFITIVYFLIYGNLVYQLARIGYLTRRRSHVPASRTTLESIYDLARPPSLSVLVPSYREVPEVVLRSLLSAALMEYPRRRVVLLIDDPPHPNDLAAAANLAAMRQLPSRILAMLDVPARRFEHAGADFARRKQQGRLDLLAETLRVSALYTVAAESLDGLAAGFAEDDHTTTLFGQRIMGEAALAHRERATQLSTSFAQRTSLSEIELAREYQRLATLFRCRITSFERKRFVNQSHEANKAMNLNSYIGLIGGNFREVAARDGLRLERCGPAVADLQAPAADYLVTLDADSLLLSDYALRLVHVMEQPENCRVAVAQTPYSAVPGTPNLLERVAGATTDIQHIIHVGFGAFRSAYWVGANALLRLAALEDIRELVEERGYRMPRYIQDRTVIEDTESTVDLIRRGWQLYNYPERLAYSATPPDFGALIIQRRRWANGGLIILPKLLQYLVSGPDIAGKLSEGFMRVHYLTSLAGVSAGMLILLLHPFDQSMRSYWLPLTAAGYYFLYGLDLKQCGYNWGDLLRVYALNLLLLPVNLGGVLKSLQQALTGSRSPFGRTPKVESRTEAPRLYIICVLLLPVYCLIRGVFDLTELRLAHAGFALLNAAFLFYAFFGFVGAREAVDDLGLRVTPAREQVIVEQVLVSGSGAG
jgi:cellulose synthase/poly-beta-1,6-N-acetylglucosamine synthase-like glycosyltransferase